MIVNNCIWLSLQRAQILAERRSIGGVLAAYITELNGKYAYVDEANSNASFWTTKEMEDTHLWDQGYVLGLAKLMRLKQSNSNCEDCIFHLLF